MNGEKVSTKVFKEYKQDKTNKKDEQQEENSQNNKKIVTDLSLGNTSFEHNGLLDSLSSDSMKEANDSIDKDIKNADDSIKKKQETTRSKIGTIFVRGFFIFMFLGFIGVIVYNVFMYVMTGTSDLFMDSAKIIPLIGSVIGTPLGFVMGYYFKR